MHQPQKPQSHNRPDRAAKGQHFLDHCDHHRRDLVSFLSFIRYYFVVKLPWVVWILSALWFPVHKNFPKQSLIVGSLDRGGSSKTTFGQAAALWQ